MSKHKPDVYKKKLLEALERTLGIVTPACKEVGVSRDTFYRYYKEDDDFKRKVDDIHEITLDFVENQLLKKIKDGSERSILFYMKYRGKSRGYYDNSNEVLSNEQPLFGPQNKSDDLDYE